jgi:hypothetical protein
MKLSRGYNRYSRKRLRSEDCNSRCNCLLPRSGRRADAIRLLRACTAARSMAKLLAHLASPIKLVSAGNSKRADLHPPYACCRSVAAGAGLAGEDADRSLRRSAQPVQSDRLQGLSSVWERIAKPISASGGVPRQTGRRHDRKPHQIAILLPHPFVPKEPSTHALLSHGLCELGCPGRAASSTGFGQPSRPP